MSRLTTAAPAVLLCLAGCFRGESACRETVAPHTLGVDITVTDSVTGQRLSNARIITTFGGRTTAVDTSLVTSADAYPFEIGDSPGTYHVQVQVPGYQPWSADEATGPATTGCEISVVQLVARLEPSAA